MLPFVLRAPSSGLGFVTEAASVARWCRHVNNYGRTVWMFTAHNDTRHLTEDPQ